MSVYYLDDDQIKVLRRVMSRLYDEMHRLGADERRDLANTMDAVLWNVERYGEVEEPKPVSVASSESLCPECLKVLTRRQVQSGVHWCSKF